MIQKYTLYTCDFCPKDNKSEIDTRNDHSLPDSKGWIELNVGFKSRVVRGIMCPHCIIKARMAGVELLPLEAK